MFGAGGYIGIPLCEELERRGHMVTPVDRFFFGKYPKLETTISLHADIRTYECPSGVFDVAIDLAGLSNDATAEINPEVTRSINLEGAKRLSIVLKQAGVKRYIYSSSCSVYGDGEHDNITEECDCKPLTLYADCKVQVEDHLRWLADASFRPVILRNATVFGSAKRMRFDLAVNIMTLRAIREGVIYQMGGGEQWRPFVSVGDVVNAFCWAAENDVSGTYNIGDNSQNFSIAQLARLVRSQVPGAQIHNIPDQPDKRSYHVSFAKYSKAYRPLSFVTPVVAGIREVAAALGSGAISGDDETCYTLQYYKSLMAWERRLDAIRLDGRIL